MQPHNGYPRYSDLLSPKAEKGIFRRIVSSLESNPSFMDDSASFLSLVLDQIPKNLLPELPKGIEVGLSYLYMSKLLGLGLITEGENGPLIKKPWNKRRRLNYKQRKRLSRSLNLELIKGYISYEESLLQ
jgi:hypothetical protein